MILFLLFSSPLNFNSARAEEPTATICIVQYTQPSPNSPIVQPTIDAIKERLRGKYKVKIYSLPREELEQWIKDGKVDIFLSSAGFYRRLINDGVRDLATAISSDYPDPNQSEGAAIVVLNKRNDLNCISDLEGKRLAVTSNNAFSSYHVPLGEIAKHGFDPFKFFSQIQQTPEGVYSERVLSELKDGKADVAFLKQCALETYLKEHPAEKSLFPCCGTERQRRSMRSINRSLSDMDLGFYKKYISAALKTGDFRGSGYAQDAGRFCLGRRD